MMEIVTSADTQVALMLTSKLGQPPDEDDRLLRQSEFVSLVRWLKEQGLTPEGLLEASNARRLEDAGLDDLTYERIDHLLSRGVALAVALERWANSGLWVIGWTDEHYPAQYKERLKGNAPPILYGTGDPSLLSRGGLCMVGSRKLDEPALEATRRIASECGRQGIQVISGGAKGVDSAAMQSCLQRDGSVVGVLADSLARAAVGADTRDWIRDGSLTLVSPFDPGSHFVVYNAMGRNKLLYALADWALVLHSAYNEGGTWSGAKENLSKQWVPLFVLLGPDAPEGNRRLVKAGGIPFEENILDQEPDLSAWLQEAEATRGNDGGQLSIF